MGKAAAAVPSLLQILRSYSIILTTDFRAVVHAFKSEKYVNRC